jgi:hypothetical protein
MTFGLHIGLGIPYWLSENVKLSRYRHTGVKGERLNPILDLGTR